MSSRQWNNKHYIKKQKILSQLSPAETHVNTISDISNLIEDSRRANILLHEGTKLIINDTLSSINPEEIY
jgi:hypothetical protein